MRVQFNYSDNEYITAVNCTHTQYYNSPMTVVITGKKFILPFGSSDNITTKQQGEGYYFIGENTGLNYISLVYIDPVNEVCESVFFNSNEINNSENLIGILNKSTEQQIKILSDYLQ